MQIKVACINLNKVSYINYTDGKPTHEIIWNVLTLVYFFTNTGFHMNSKIHV